MVTRAELIKELDAMEARWQADADRLRHVGDRLGALNLTMVPAEQMRVAITSLAFCLMRLDSQDSQA